MKSSYTFFLVLFAFFSCGELEKGQEIERKIIQDHVSKTSVLSVEQREQITGSSTWKSIPESVIDRVDKGLEVLVTEYDHSVITSISFQLRATSNSVRYEALTILANGENYIAIIVRSERVGDFIKHSISDLAQNSYFEFYTNKENKLGKFSLNKEIPFDQLNPEKGNLRLARSIEEPEDTTCPDKTSKFGDCMLCAINECANDWVCAVVCTAMSQPCLIGFALACAS
jgi:hypothetical protein